MREYLEWQQDRGPVRVRIHRRVLGGLEREAANGMSGIVLGSISESGREVRIEDYMSLDTRDEFDPTLPAVGYFFTGSPRDADGVIAAGHFIGSPHVALRFEFDGEGVRLANVAVESGEGRQPISSALREDAGSVTKHRVHFRAGEVAPRDVAPREVLETEETPGGWRSILWPAIAILAGFLIGGAAYMAVRGDSPKPPPTAASQPPPKDPLPAAPSVAEPPASPLPTPAVNEADRAGEAAPNRADIQRGVRSALDRWSATLLKNDVTAHTALYAPTVGPYFKKNRASREEVAGEIRDMVKRYGPIRQYKISELTIAPVDANHALANFRKQWATAGNRFTGADREQLRFVRDGADWLIESEQELKVYWVHRK